MINTKIPQNGRKDKEEEARRQALAIAKAMLSGEDQQEEGQKYKGRVLDPEYPIPVGRRLAVLVGFNEAAVLQQIHYWLTVAEEKGNNYRDGHYWTYNSLRSWMDQFPWWGKNTLVRIFKNLEEKGYLIVGNYNKYPPDRTKWYRINYEKLKTLMDTPFTQNGYTHLPKMGKCHLPKMGTPIPKISLPNNSSKSTKIGLGSIPEKRGCSIPFKTFKSSLKEQNSEAIMAIEYFVKAYEMIKRESHPKLKRETWEEILDNILYVEAEHNKTFDLSLEDIKEMTKHYFAKGDYYQENCNFSIAHFNSPGIKRVNFWEAAY